MVPGASRTSATLVAGVGPAAVPTALQRPAWTSQWKRRDENERGVMRWLGKRATAVWGEDESLHTHPPGWRIRTAIGFFLHTFRQRDHTEQLGIGAPWRAPQMFAQ